MSMSYSCANLSIRLFREMEGTNLLAASFADPLTICHISSSDSSFNFLPSLYIITFIIIICYYADCADRSIAPNINIITRHTLPLVTSAHRLGLKTGPARPELGKFVITDNINCL